MTGSSTFGRENSGPSNTWPSRRAWRTAFAWRAKRPSPVLSVFAVSCSTRPTSKWFWRNPRTVSGHEARIAILFSDICNFTPFSEAQLPYDVVHILNRYFHAMGEAVLQNEGYIDKYVGDGLMALFGLGNEGPAEACWGAVSAGLQMLESLDALNLALKNNFGVEFGMRIGIHFGEVVVGAMGHPRKSQFTAIGDTVNLASRIEAACKGTGARLLISEAVHAHLRDRLQTGIEVTTELKGKSGTYKLYEVLGGNDAETHPRPAGVC